MEEGGIIFSLTLQNKLKAKVSGSRFKEKNCDNYASALVITHCLVLKRLRPKGQAER